MHPLIELMNDEITAQNEIRQNDAIPNGAIIGLDSLIHTVKRNQQPTPKHWRPWSAYLEIELHPSNEHLQGITLPETLATLYKVCVPRTATSAYIQPLYVPVFTELSHDPAMFGFSDKLDQERRLLIPRHFPAWRKVSSSAYEFALQYQHVETLGFLPEKRNNDWMTFFSMDAAEEYLAHIKVNAKPETKRSKFITLALAEDVFGDFV